MCQQVKPCLLGRWMDPQVCTQRQAHHPSLDWGTRPAEKMGGGITRMNTTSRGINHHRARQTMKAQWQLSALDLRLCAAMLFIKIYVHETCTFVRVSVHERESERAKEFMKGNSCTLLFYFIVFSRESVTFHCLVGIGQRKQEGKSMTTYGCDFGEMPVKYEIETRAIERLFFTSLAP